MRETSDINALIELMAKLPGLGPVSARRAVLHLIRKRQLMLNPLANLIQRVAKGACACENCGNIGMTTICEICSDTKRNRDSLCVVEDVADLWAMERSGVFTGQYHVLGGTLSALDSIGPEELRIPHLVQRVENEQFSEVILALNATIDGQTTAHYIADKIADRCRITSLARGVPIGGELDYLDDGTITTAMRARQTF
ncbi:MAG: recombination mediator RecR [Aestuariivita sp.]|nr:recombination mediator RecR [Aestuariivita sp.]